MIKLRTWEPLPYTYSQHSTLEKAVEKFFKVFDEYIEEYGDKRADYMIKHIEVSDIEKMYTLYDTKLDEYIKTHRKKRGNEWRPGTQKKKNSQNLAK